MFKITSTQVMEWPALQFTILKGNNVFTSRKAVPEKLWPKLDRFRALKLLDFEGKAEAGKDEIQLEELTEHQLFQMSKPDLVDLAKASSVSIPDGASKKTLLEALVAKLATEEKTVEITEESLAPLKLDELKQVAAELSLDVAGLTSKRQFIDRILASQAEPAPSASGDSAAAAATPAYP